MDTSSNPPSFFQELKTRELNGVKVRKRPYLGNLKSDSGSLGTGVVSFFSPPLAVSFSKVKGNSHFLAISDEYGYVHLYDTRKKLPSFTPYSEKSVEARVWDWKAHDNAIFDVCWIKNDSQILTASGDQSINIWDIEKKTSVGVLIYHSGSVKSLSAHPSNPHLVASSSRDGSFALWDLRCNPTCRSRRCGPSLLPTDMVDGAHTSVHGKRARHGKAPSMSITSVLYLKDEICIASAGAVHSVVKFWDTRNLILPITQTPSNAIPSNEKGKRAHGISCLSQDSNGVFLSASCMDHRIYVFNMLQLDKGPVHTFSGGQFGSFYVKSAISPDAAYVLSGSSDGNAYIWQMKKPDADPILLKSHDSEVTAVDWCPSETGKVATASDDFTVRVWNIGKGYTSGNSPLCIRKRVTSKPNIERRKLFMDEDPTDLTNGTSSSCHQHVSNGDCTPKKISKSEIVSEISAPKSSTEMFSLNSFTREDRNLENTPEAEMQSPSSVLNPPPSLKRKTIRDYFVSTS